MQKEAGNDVKKQIGRGFELATLRTIDDRSLQALTKLYNTAFSQSRTILQNVQDVGACRHVCKT